MTESYDAGATTTATTRREMAPAAGATVASGSTSAGAVSAGDPSIGELFARLTADTSELLRGEVRLAKAEIKQEAKTAAKGAGALGAAGFAGYMALLLLSFAAAWGLAEVIAPGVAFLIVGLVYAVVAIVLVMRGKRQLAGINPVPEQTVETLKEDARWLKRKK
jgi:uncharacterized membrane protein YqjE